MKITYFSSRTNSRPTCNGYVCLYSCLEKFKSFIGDNNNKVETVLLPYRYEIFSTLNTTDLSSELRLIESKILDELSSITNLDNCNIDNDAHAETDDIIMSLASSPADAVDTENVNCVTEDSNIPAGTTCIPIKGEMVIRYASIVPEDSSSNDESVSNSMTTLIQMGMNQDHFVTQNIVKLNFIEENVEDATTLPPLFENNSETITVGANTGGGNLDERLSHQASSANVGVAVSTATLVALFVVGSVFLVKRKFRKSNEDLKVVNQEDSFSQQDEFAKVETGNRRHKHHLDDSDMMDDCDDNDDDNQAVMNPAKAKYCDSEDDDTFLRSKQAFLSTISEVSEETDSSVNNSMKGSPSASSVPSGESFSRILSESIYNDDPYV